MTKIERPRILLGVTSQVSLRLMRGFPEHLASKGWEVHVVSGGGDSVSPWAQSETVTFHEIKMERDPAIMADIRSLREWVALCRDIRPHVVSVGTPKAGFIGGLSSFVTRVPSRIYLQRGLRLETTTGMKQKGLAVIERITTAVTHRTLAVSKSLETEMINRNLVKPKKISVLGEGSSNGVDLNEFAKSSFSEVSLSNLRKDLSIDKSIAVIGFVGRLTSDKGFDALEAAAKILHDQEIRFSLLIVGDVEDAASRIALNRLLLSGIKVASTGPVLNPAPYFQLMTVLCLPTLREGFPNVVLEASASSIPTVTTNATGAVDSVVDQKTGYVVEMGDIDSLAAALANVLSDPTKAALMGAQAREWVEENFSRPAVWSRLEEYYCQRLVEKLPQFSNWTYS